MEVIIADENSTEKYLIYLLNWKQSFFLILLERATKKAVKSY